MQYHGAQRFIAFKLCVYAICASVGLSLTPRHQNGVGSKLEQGTEALDIVARKME